MYPNLKRMFVVLKELAVHGITNFNAVSIRTACLGYIP